MKCSGTSTKEKQEKVKRYAKQITDGMGVQKIKTLQVKVSKDGILF